MPDLEALFRCPECGFVGTLDDFDVLGADDGKLFCPVCTAEEEMIEVPSERPRKKEIKGGTRMKQ